MILAVSLSLLLPVTGAAAAPSRCLRGESRRACLVRRAEAKIRPWRGGARRLASRARGVGSRLKGAAGGLLAKGRKAMGRAKSFALTRLQRLRKGAKGLAGRGREGAQGLVGRFGGLASRVKGLATRVRSGVKGLLGRVRNLASGARRGTGGLLSRAKSAVGNLVSRGINAVNAGANKSPAKLTGQYCTKDSYFDRFKNDEGHDGLANFGTVVPGVLYRGSQPFTKGQADASGHKGNGFDTLKKLGVKCRILLRTTTRTDQLLREKTELAKRGIKLFHLPVSTLLFGPPAAKVLGLTIKDSARALFTKALVKARDQFMAIVGNRSNGPCYLACQSGKDRTGVLVGWYRAVKQGWKPARIFAERADCKFGPDGHYAYFQRLFCGWYGQKFGKDATCDRVLATKP